MRPTLLWFKRDLRLQDHAALCDAARRGPVLPLAIVEPQAWRQPDSARQQGEYAAECLQDQQAGRQDMSHPMTLLDLQQACREARARLHARRAEPGVRAARTDMLRRAASRAPAGGSARQASGTRRGPRPADGGPAPLSQDL